MKHKQKGTLWITMGLLLIAAALFLTAWNLYDGLRAERSAGQVMMALSEYLPTQPALEAPGETLPDPLADAPDYVRFPEMEMPVQTINGYDYIGVLRIPALELELPVISDWSYAKLKIAPCRYSGSAYLHNLILCAHNFSTHFGGLKNLSEGDIAVFTDMAGNEFTYTMVQRETLLPSDVTAMESGDWDLTLFTCTIGGQTRVTLRFVLEGE